MADRVMALSNLMLVLLCAAACLSGLVQARGIDDRRIASSHSELPLGGRNSAVEVSLDKKHKKKRPFTSPTGLFIQERASKQLPGPGQHFSFGALRPWEDILGMLEEREDRKLVFLVRHGQAISNWLSEELGPDEWYKVEQTCAYDAGNGTVHNVFDAELTNLGEDQAHSLNLMLKEAGWFDKLTGGQPVRVVVSPLSRCLTTARIVMNGIQVDHTNVEELVRETLGEDTCDARRSVSDPDPEDRSKMEGPCSFDHGLVSKYPDYQFKVAGEDKTTFGLFSDKDEMWTKNKRERQHHQVKRAEKFLYTLFENAPEPVIFVVTHSGFTRSVLLAVHHEPYRPQNAELVPVIVDYHSGRYLEEEAEDYEEQW